MSFKTILKISRPRFWIYLFGPYILGALLTTQTPLWVLIAWGVYFSFPANLLVYGINDIYDYATDKNNEKKQKYETLVTPKMQGTLWTWILITNVPFFLLLILAPQVNITAFWAFLLFSIFYSAKPVRAKAIPFIDGLFNVLYILPAFFIADLSELGLFALVAGWLWCIAMHAYSAIPDIQEDTKAGISTVATKLGFQGTHYYCILMYFLSGLVGTILLGYVSLFFFVPYLLLVSRSATSDPKHIFKYYTYFPYLNLAVGFLLFLYILINRFQWMW